MTKSIPHYDSRNTDNTVMLQIQVLLTGPSGTGKTMIAKAIACEIEGRFISCCGSDLVEVYVGRGAARIRGVRR
jgi:ATP-dependent 26S proteasome regulatory subunit